MRQHILLWASLVLVCALLFSCSSSGERKGTPSHRVLVSIAPYKFFVEKIAGDTVEVRQMIPIGGSPHFYEPTAKQILAASEADIWFQIGETFETRATQALQSYRSNMKIIDMREDLDLISVASDEGTYHHCHHHECSDPHIWLSPRLVKKQAETIAKALMERYPENAQLYRDRLATFQEELEALDREISQQLLPLEDRTIVVSHPSYAYFGRDYQLEQVSIEFEGKDPTPQQLTKVLNTVRQLGARTLFVQPQHFSKGTRLIANELGANIVVLDPLAEDYLDNMRMIARSFSEK